MINFATIHGNLGSIISDRNKIIFINNKNKVIVKPLYSVFCF